MINEPVKPAPTETQDQMRLFRDMPFVKFWAYWPFLVRFGGRPETGGSLLTAFLYLLRDTHGELKVRKKLTERIMKMLSCCAYLRGRI